MLLLVSPLELSMSHVPGKESKPCLLSSPNSDDDSRRYPPVETYAHRARVRVSLLGTAAAAAALSSHRRKKTHWARAGGTLLCSLRALSLSRSLCLVQQHSPTPLTSDMYITHACRHCCACVCRDGQALRQTLFVDRAALSCVWDTRNNKSYQRWKRADTHV